MRTRDEDRRATRHRDAASQPNLRMTDSTPISDRSARRRREPPYFLQPAQGGVAVFRRPCGNRAEPKLCGVMPGRGQAAALVAQLKRAEEALDDLFLEATDDGIEALEAVLQACREAVLTAPPQQRRGPGRGPGGGPGSGPGRGPRRPHRRPRRD